MHNCTIYNINNNNSIIKYLMLKTISPVALLSSLTQAYCILLMSDKILLLHDGSTFSQHGGE